ncbi:DUF222 domain-containing protein [Microbispora hainanensis]|uniref:DUF222 domain-containing protein n=1 Tax=Microbispora hainanensis TaxID=568844 RepID=UPI0034091C27
MDLFDVDPDRLHRSSDTDGEWWDRLIANSPLWSSDGSSARDPFPIIHFESRQRADGPGTASTDDPGADVPAPHTDGVDAISADNDGADVTGEAAASANAAGTNAVCWTAADADAADADAADTDAADTDAARWTADNAGSDAGAAREAADGADAAGTNSTGANGAGAAGPGAGASGGVGGRGRGPGRVRSSWVVVGSVREVAQELALVPLPDDVDMCLAEAEELLFARDRITCALADRVGRVHRARQVKQHGHASTRSWLRTAGGMTVGGAGRLLLLGAELPRLPVVREKFAAGELAAGMVEAICAAVAGLTDEQATLAEPILVELASKAGAAEVAKAGRHLRAVLDPDGEERDEQADYGRRFLRVRPGKGGGVEGEFYLPRESGARLMTLLQEYAKKKADGDDRTLTERQADALIAALEQQIVTELLVVVSAESLPTDPENTDPYPADDTSDPATDDDVSDPATDDTSAPAPAEADVSDHFVDLGDSAPSDYVPDPAGSSEAPSEAVATGDCGSDAESADHPTGTDDTVCRAMGDPGAAGGTDSPDVREEFDAAEAGAEASAGSADDISDSAPHRADDNVSDAISADDSTEAEAGVDAGSDAGDDGVADGRAASTDSPSDGTAADACDIAAADASGVGRAKAHPAATAPTTDSADATAGLRDEESCGCGVGGRGASERWPGECEPRDIVNAASAEEDDTPSTSSAEGDEAAPADGDRRDYSAAPSGASRAWWGASAWPADGGGHSHTAPSDTASSGATPSDAPPSQAAPSEAVPPHAAHSEAAWPDPPPEDASVHHTHAGPRPARDCRHGQDTPGTSQRASSGAAPGGAPGGTTGTMPGASLGTALGATLGASLGMVPGLLLATGQVLPVSSVHRLARTSTLVRIVMNADGQVLDMGRKVRLATPAQRRAIYARYATCWIDGCPLPATMCQIDHADNWSTGGLTDLKLLGPACQFHNRDRYQHPDRYTRRKEGTDRWAFTYHRLGRARRLRE